jgi:hypothetical protein
MVGLEPNKVVLMNLLRKLLLVLMILVLAGFGYKRIDYRDGMYKNVCKDLKNNILVYFIFVDSKVTAPWTTFDIQTTIDSMEVAIQWIESQANQHNIRLNLISDYYIGQEFTTIKRNLPYETVAGSAITPSFSRGIAGLNDWADRIAQRIGKEVHIVEKDGIPDIKNPGNKERLTAHLRDKYEVESVALLYMVNNYYKDDISLTVNHLDSRDVEFAIVSYKYPAVIAQNILNLFGAADLYKTLYRRNEQKIKLAREFFPQDIMQDVYAAGIDERVIGELTAYLIGWSASLDPMYHPLLTDKIVNY